MRDNLTQTHDPEYLGWRVPTGNLKTNDKHIKRTCHGINFKGGGTKIQ